MVNQPTTKEASLHNVGKIVSLTNNAGQTGLLHVKNATEIKSFFNTIHKISSKLIIDPNVRLKIIKLLEENIN